MVPKIPEFGAAEPNCDYQLRLGGYAIIQGDVGLVAVVATPFGLVLPGGGQEKEESPERAAVRETAEECGLHITLRGCIGVADELVYDASECTHYRKRCTFLLATAISMSGVGEADHELMWLLQSDAIVQLRFGSQRWAMSKAHYLL